MLEKSEELQLLCIQKNKQTLIVYQILIEEKLIKFGWYFTDKIIVLKDLSTYKSLPLGQWRYQTTDESEIPLTSKIFNFYLDL